MSASQIPMCKTKYLIIGQNTAFDTTMSNTEQPVIKGLKNSV